MDPRLDPEVFWPRLRGALEQVDEADRTPPPEARVGAVLVLLQDAPDGPQVVLTRRRRDLRSHPGQVSFAGGRLDAGESIEEAALREAEEEIGLAADSVEVVGVGPKFYIPPSRFWVVPVLGRWRAPHELRPNPWEVDEILRVPLARLLRREHWRHVPLSLRGSSWAWQLEDDLLWGATAIVMSLLLDVAVEGWSEGTRPEDLPEELAVRPWEEAPAWQRRMRLAGDLPEVAQGDVPHVTAAEIREVHDLLADAGVPDAAVAEHAGRALTHAARRLVGTSLADVQVTVLIGPGGNGAGGLAAVRLLVTAGADVRVWLTGEIAVPSQLEALRMADVRYEVVDPDDPPGEGRAPGDLVIDAMVGVGADPPLRGAPELLAGWLRRHDVPVIALDLPSGLGADVGLRGSCVTADVTVTLAAPKVGLQPRITHPYVGDLYLADIGVPPALWRRVGIEPVVFDRGPLVRLTSDEAASDAGTPDQGEVPPVAPSRD